MVKEKKIPILYEKPDIAALKDISYPSERAVQPGWISERYTEYAEDRGMRHELTSVRTAEHAGHSIKITTTYEIEIDGRAVHLHAAVGDDGQLRCHTTPYERYHSAVDLVKTLIDRFPESFAEGEGGHGHAHAEDEK